MASPTEHRQPNSDNGGAPSTGQPTEVLTGLIEGVTFHNNANGCCVLRIKTPVLRQIGKGDQIRQVHPVGVAMAISTESDAAT